MLSRMKMNWFGLSGGITIFVLIAVSLFVPWWQLTVGDGLVKANASPLNTNFNFIGNPFTIPIIWALNIASIISLTAGGIAILIYSIKPTKPYSNRLLSFSYRKPLYSILLFVIVLIMIIWLVNSTFQLAVPLLGTEAVVLPTNLTQGINISVLMSAGFIWPFGLAITAASLCIIARIYHKKILPSSDQPNTNLAPTTAGTPT